MGNVGWVGFGEGVRDDGILQLGPCVRRMLLGYSAALCGYTAGVALGNPGRMLGQYQPYPVGADIPFASVIFTDVREACIFIENISLG